MKQPAYHLRSNKAVDRLTLIDAIKRAAKLVDDISEYTYYGFGGPYLEDFRLLYEFYPEINMVSIEDNDEIFKRQRFHIPCHSTQLKLKKIDFSSFLARYDSNGKSIFWLDYLDLKYGNFEDFMTLLAKVTPNSLIKLTLRCEPTDYFDKDQRMMSQKKLDFQKQFGDLLPHPDDKPSNVFEDLAKLLQEMVQIAAQKGLPSAMPLKFMPISSFRYADGVGMFTLTGIVCFRNDETKIRRVFQTWHLKNLDWNAPRMIDVPTLSTKERLHLQRRLPCNSHAGRILRRALGYLIENDLRRTESKLKQYADFHRYFPYFMKAVP